MRVLGTTRLAELGPETRVIAGTVCSLMTNKSGGQLDVGQWLVPGTGDLEVTTTSAFSTKCIGTVAEASPADGAGVWVTQTRFLVQCTGPAVAVGEYLDGIGSQGRAYGVTFPFPDVFAIAVTGKAGGSPGSVWAMKAIAELF